MSSFQTPETTTPRRRRRLLPLVSLGVAGLFLATACASGQDDTPEPHDDAASASQSAAPERAAVGEGQGEPDALEGLSFSEGEDGAPSVEVDGELATDVNLKGARFVDPGRVEDDGTLVFGHQYVLDSPVPIWSFGHGLSYTTFN